MKNINLEKALGVVNKYYDDDSVESISVEEDIIRFCCTDRAMSDNDAYLMVEFGFIQDFEHSNILDFSAGNYDYKKSWYAAV